MNRLTIEEVQQIKDDWNDPNMGKPNNFWENRINSLFDTIEAQQQEIDKLKNTIKGNYAIVKALTTDKDEQAGTIMRLESALKCLHDLLSEHEPIWYLRKHDKIAIDALLGGKEDG